MGTTSDYAKEISAIYEKVEELQKAIPSEFGYKLKSVLSNYHSMFTRFCPFNIGDRVVLAKTPEILPGNGWYGSRHFLVEGAKATVMERDYYSDRFMFALEFDDDSWIDNKGQKQPSQSKLTFSFGESWIKPLEEVVQSQPSLPSAEPSETPARLHPR